MAEPIVIIGAGQAGIRAAETLRKLGCGERIVMLGDEPYPPYQRPPLSKKFLLGEMAEAQLYLQGERFFEQNRVELITGARAIAIHPHKRRVTLQGVAAPLGYSKLLIATGCRPRLLAVPGAKSAGLESLRSIADVVRLREKLRHAAQTVIVGGGYIGLEVAAVLRSLGKPVILLEAQSRLLSRVTCPAVSAFFEQLHRGHGVDIRLNVQLAGFRRCAGATHIDLADGGSIAADLVLVAIGAAANDTLARDAGLPTQDGILVDGSCRVAEDIFAAGDCTRFVLPRYGRRVRLESVQNANDQARAAAQAMLGEAVRYDPVPWFWSDQYDVKLQIAGLGEGHDALTTEGEPDGVSFAVSYFRDGKLIAVDAVNRPKVHMQARRSLAETMPVGAL